MSRVILVSRSSVLELGVHRYVSPSGSDSTGDGSSGSPWRTINKAATMAPNGSGMTIHVASGTYNETIQFSKSGTFSDRIRFVSDVRWGAKIWPTQNLNSHIFRLTGNYVDVEGFDMGPGGSNVVVFGVDTTGTNNAFRHNKIHHINVSGSNVGSAVGIGGLNSIFDSNIIYNAGHSQLDHCMYAYTGHGHTIINNIVGNAAGWCITLWHNAYEVFIYNNTVFNGRRALGSNGGGILIGAGESPDSDARNCIVANNIIYDNQGDGIIEFGIVHNNKYINNLFYNNDWENISLVNGTESGTIIGNPQFVNYIADGTGDYHILSSSAAIDMAHPLYTPTLDFDGLSHFVGAAPDIGAYEFQ